MYKLLVIIVALSAVSCNMTRVVKPLDKGEHRVGASVGGPVINFQDLPVALPLSSISYAHGLDTGLSVSAGIHTTSLTFGVAQADVGAHINVFQSSSERFGITASPAIHFFYDFNGNEYRNYPQLDANVWWSYGERKNLVYGGLGTWLELYRAKAHNEVQAHEFMPYVTLGHQFNRETWSLQIEARYIGMFYDNQDLVVDYMTPFNQGAAGVYVGISKSIFKQ